MDRGVRSGRWRGEGLGVNSTADIGCFQETHCGLLDLAFSPADKHSQQISSQTFPSQFLPLGPIRLKWYCCCLRLSVCPSVCLFVCDCWSISMTKLVLVITRIFFESFWNLAGIFFWRIILRQVWWWVLQLVKYAHTVEPLWKGQESCKIGSISRHNSLQIMFILPLMTGNLLWKATILGGLYRGVPL